jgi:hypothetical protein
MAEFQVSIIALTALVLAVCGLSAALRKLVHEGQEWWKLFKPLTSHRKRLR